MLIITVLLSIAFGLLLMMLHMILPWLFGPIIAAASVRKISGRQMIWPKWLADSGLFILGAQIGTSFTLKVLSDIRNDLFHIVLLNIIIIGAAILLSLIYRKITQCSYETAFLSAVPGALSQMIVMAEENKRADLLAVTLSQTSRLLFVVMIVPFIASFSSGAATGSVIHSESIFHVLSFNQILFIVSLTGLFFIFLRRIHFPVPQLLAPIFIMAGWNIVTGDSFSIPYYLIAAAQLLFGIRIGLQLVDLSSSLTFRLFLGITVQNTLLILVTFVAALFMTDHPFNDTFLSLAPGGMAQIVIVALETGSNIAMISSYHIFRIFLILLVVAPFMQTVLKRFDKSI
ncbi:AbrB family transcriptional regulator [Macrococcus brunensis]|uniref:AbrB family transcriptional regulator n=1 Tax=Macrococcus brunensis TaxID=198483 RepID=UPI001EF0B364|nr:AbrB family transcriptional regulator [Macrococcus brunensis]ULG73549.1 AbrB family transcriptional regulator [Macrococcus brunensis]